MTEEKRLTVTVSKERVHECKDGRLGCMDACFKCTFNTFVMPLKHFSHTFLTRFAVQDCRDLFCRYKAECSAHVAELNFYYLNNVWSPIMVLLAVMTTNARVYGVVQGTETCLPAFIHIAFVPGHAFSATTTVTTTTSTIKAPLI